MTLDKEELLSYKSTSDNELPYTRINDFMDFVYQNNLYEYTDDIYDDNGIRELIESSVKTSGWERVKYMLEDIDNTNCDYLIKDGYGNFKNITNIDINSIINNIVYDLDKENQQEVYEL